MLKSKQANGLWQAHAPLTNQELKRFEVKHCTLKIRVPKIKNFFGPILISGLNYMVVFNKKVFGSVVLIL